MINCGLTPGGYGEGIEEVDVLAAASRRPKGSFRFDFDIRRTEPAKHDQQPWSKLLAVESAGTSEARFSPSLPSVQELDLPGTSSVSASFKMPKHHFSGFIFLSLDGFDSSAELEDSRRGLSWSKKTCHLECVG